MDQRVVDIVNLKIIPEFPDDKKQIGILLILEIAAALLTIFKECKNLRNNLEKDAEPILKTIRNPNLFNRIRLYLIVKRQCRKNNVKPEFQTIVDAILKAGKVATLDDLKTLAEVASKP